MSNKKRRISGACVACAAIRWFTRVTTRAYPEKAKAVDAGQDEVSSKVAASPLHFLHVQKYIASWLPLRFESSFELYDSLQLHLQKRVQVSQEYAAA